MGHVDMVRAVHGCRGLSRERCGLVWECADAARHLRETFCSQDLRCTLQKVGTVLHALRLNW